MALSEKQSIREIRRRTGLSHNTIKYPSAGTIEPTFNVPERPSKLDPFADKLAGWLKTEAGKSRKQRRSQVLNLIRKIRGSSGEKISRRFNHSGPRVPSSDVRRRRSTTEQKLTIIEQSFEPG
jgi:hypothetical protein